MGLVTDFAVKRWERALNRVIGYRRSWRWQARYEDGCYWADSATHPEFTAASDTLDGLLKLIYECGVIERWGYGKGLIHHEAVRADLRRRQVSEIGARVRVKARPEWDATVYSGKLGSVVPAPESFTGDLVFVALDEPAPGQRNPLGFHDLALEPADD